MFCMLEVKGNPHQLHPWLNICMNFVLGFTPNPTGHGFNLDVDWQVFQYSQFVDCRETMDCPSFIFRKIVSLHEIPWFNLEWDTKFMNDFWKSLWEKMRTKLNFSSIYLKQMIEVGNIFLGNLMRGLAGLSQSSGNSLYLEQSLLTIEPRTWYTDEPIWDYV